MIVEHVGVGFFFTHALNTIGFHVNDIHLTDCTFTEYSNKQQTYNFFHKVTCIVKPVYPGNLTHVQ